MPLPQAPRTSRRADAPAVLPRRDAGLVRQRRRAESLGVLLVLGVLLPALALACTAAVVQGPRASLEGPVLVGLALLVPFLAVAVGVWAAWRAARQDAHRDE